MSFGAYGKIAGLGDFLRFGLPRDFVQAWDEWLQSSIAEAERHYDDMWADYYNSAPIWRFALPANTIGEAPMLGVLMPSVDRVGRRFPLTLAAAVPNEEVPLFALYLHSDALFAQLDDIALATLSGEISPAQLEDSLSGIGLPVTGPVTKRDSGDVTLYQRSGQGGNAVDDLAAALAGADSRLGYWSTRAFAMSQAFATRETPDLELFLHLVNPLQSDEVPA